MPDNWSTFSPRTASPPRASSGTGATWRGGPRPHARDGRATGRAVRGSGKFAAGGTVILLASATCLLRREPVRRVLRHAGRVPGRAGGRQDVPAGRDRRAGIAQWEPRTLDLSFTLSDGKATVPVRHRGTPPDLFARGPGAVVEGRGVARATSRPTLIMAKHSEEYKAPHDGDEAGYKELMKSLRGAAPPGGHESRPRSGYAGHRGRLRPGALRQRDGGGGRRARGRPALLESSERAAVGVWVLVTGCMLLLVYAFLTFDFSVRYVASNTSRGTPFYYRITALWGALEGSIILWCWMISLYTLIVVARYRRRQPRVYPWVLAARRGGRLLPARDERWPRRRSPASVPHPRGRARPEPASRGLGHDHASGGPLPGLHRVHRPVRVRHRGAGHRAHTGDEWITITRRWTIVAWYFLSLGLLIGGWWSYHVLGWGGYWAWDPVENAAFMPWLTGTALLHSVMIQERRRMLKLWNLSLVILTFGLTIFGTFLTRSGHHRIRPLVHPGHDRAFFLGFLVGGPAGVLLAPRLADGPAARRGGARLDPLARVGVPAEQPVPPRRPPSPCSSGRSSRCSSEAVKGAKVSVGAPFFNLVNIPLFLGLLFLMGVGPLIAWRRASADNLRRNFLIPVGSGIAAALVLRVGGVGNVLVLGCMGLVVFVSPTMALDFARAARARRPPGAGWGAATWGLLLNRTGATAASSCTWASWWWRWAWPAPRRGRCRPRRRSSAASPPPSPVTACGSTGSRRSEESNHGKVTGAFTGEPRRAAPPRPSAGPRSSTSRSRRRSPRWTTGSASLEDVYVVLGDFAPDGSHATVKLQVNRMVSWLWIGGLVLTLGSVLAAAARRRRSRDSPVALAVPLAASPCSPSWPTGSAPIPREIPSPLVGRPAAGFALKTSTAGPRAGGAAREMVVLNFWASWCFPACYDEAPALARAWRQYRNRDMVLIGVNIQDKEEPARKFLSQFTHTFPNAPDPGARCPSTTASTACPRRTSSTAGPHPRQARGRDHDEVFRRRWSGCSRSRLRSARRAGSPRSLALLAALAAAARRPRRSPTRTRCTPSRRSSAASSARASPSPTRRPRPPTRCAASSASVSPPATPPSRSWPTSWTSTATGSSSRRRAGLQHPGLGGPLRRARRGPRGRGDHRRRWTGRRAASVRGPARPRRGDARADRPRAGRAPIGDRADRRHRGCGACPLLALIALAARSAAGTTRRPRPAFRPTLAASS